MEKDSLCKSSPVCSHNLYGRDLNKPCSIRAASYVEKSEKDAEWVRTMKEANKVIISALEFSLRKNEQGS